MRRRWRTPPTPKVEWRQREKFPPNEGAWWYDGRDLMHKKDGVWRAMLSPHNRDWHDLSEADCAEIAAALTAFTTSDCTQSLPNASGSCSPLVGQAAQEDGT